MPGIDTNTKLCLHLDNNVTDSASGGKTVTNSNVTFSNTSGQYKWGYGGVFNGTSAKLSLADSDDWNFGSGDWTIDFWVRFNDVSAAQYFYSQYADNNNCFHLRWAINNRFYIEIYNAATETLVGYANWTPVTNTWYHIEVVKSNSTAYLFIDGIGQTLNDSSFNGSCPNVASELYIGASANAGTSPVNGWMDEFRVSKGIARHTANFTPPTAPYDTSTTTIKKLSGVAYASLKKVEGVAIASCKKILGQA